MSQYNFDKNGNIKSLDGEFLGCVIKGGEIYLENESLRSDVLRDLRHQVQNDDSIVWPDELLAAAVLPPVKQAGKIRLACVYCDTDEADWIDELPESWEILEEVQTVAESLQTPEEKSANHSSFDWYTHLGICPCCRENQ